MKKFFKAIGFFIGGLIIALCAVLIFFNLTHTYHNVKGRSMSPTLNSTATNNEESIDGVFASKIKGYGRGDIVIINKHKQDGNGKDIYIIKRLIAIGGDRVTVRLVDGDYRIVLVKGGTDEEVILDEDYLESYQVNIRLNTKFTALRMTGEYNFDEDGFLVLAEDEIFYLGDNREDSEDSSNTGPKLKSDIVGKVDYIIYGNTHVYLQVIKQFFGW